MFCEPKKFACILVNLIARPVLAVGCLFFFSARLDGKTERKELLGHKNDYPEGLQGWVKNTGCAFSKGTERNWLFWPSQRQVHRRFGAFFNKNIQKQGARSKIWRKENNCLI